MFTKDKCEKESGLVKGKTISECYKEIIKSDLMNLRKENFNGEICTKLKRFRPISIEESENINENFLEELNIESKDSVIGLVGSSGFLVSKFNNIANTTEKQKELLKKIAYKRISLDCVLKLKEISSMNLISVALVMNSIKELTNIDEIDNNAMPDQKLFDKLIQKEYLYESRTYEKYEDKNNHSNMKIFLAKIIKQ